jgi:hypothetical protein
LAAKDVLYVFLPTEKYPMRISVQADEGDEVSISADFVSVEQAIQVVDVRSTCRGAISDRRSTSLPVGCCTGRGDEDDAGGEWRAFR